MQKPHSESRSGSTRADQTRQLSTGMKRLVTGIRLLMEDALEEQGITLAQLRMLNSLSDHPEISAAEMARTCFITPQSMQAIVIRAEAEGWIRRTPSPANRRILSATLTPAGRRVLQLGLKLYEQTAAQIWSSATVAELRTLNATLDKAVQQMQPLLDDLHGKSAARRKTA